MTSAFKQVVKNKGCAGVDGISIKHLKSHMHDSWGHIKTEIQSGTYRPQPVLGKEIEKSSGGKRLLGIPTVTDRVIQQSIQQVLSTIYEPEFSDYSYGFRKGKNCHQAIHKALEYVNSGQVYVVDIDLSKFFDRVNHDYLMSLLTKKVKDKLLLKLIRKYLQSGIMLDELDTELSRRGHNFVRYADDFSIYVKTKRSAYRVMRSMTNFLARKLKLKVNTEKSAVRYAGHMELLGYGIYRMRNQKFGLKVSEKSWLKFKQKCKQISRKSRPYSLIDRIEKLRSLGYGWIGYFRYANIKARLYDLDRLLTSRLRYCIWKSWKRIRTRIRYLKRLGVPEHVAIKWGLNRSGGWHIVNSPILKTTITLERLRQ